MSEIKAIGDFLYSYNGDQMVIAKKSVISSLAGQKEVLEKLDKIAEKIVKK